LLVGQLRLLLTPVIGDGITAGRWISARAGESRPRHVEAGELPVTDTPTHSGRTLGSTLGHPVGVADHRRLAWLVSSVATIGGALGSGLKSNAAVRAAAHRYQPEQTND
jgi:hypothetical protein